MTAVIISIIVVILLLVWALRGDKVKMAAQERAKVQAAERARLGISDADAILMHNAGTFGLWLDTHRNTVGAKDQAHGQFTGSMARIETEGELTSRITVTRLATLGIFALGARKKVDQRELYLTVEGDGFQIVLSVSPTLGVQARRFAAAYNTRSGAMAKTETAAPAGIAGQLADLGRMHQAGQLTDDEFAAAKAQLLTPAPSAPQDAVPTSHMQQRDRTW